ARLADQAQRLAAADVECDAVDRVDLADGALQQPSPHREVLDQVLHRKQRRGHAAATRSAWKQAAKWPPSFSSNGGGRRRQISVAKAQRSAKAQPGIASFSDGTVPAISASRAGRSCARLAPSRGTELSSPLV